MRKLYMVKLSQQQIIEDVKPTRTQRVVQKQTQEREQRKTTREETAFRNLRKRAEEKQVELNKSETIEEYEQQYSLLDPELKQFFDPPSTLRGARTERIDTTKQTIQEKITKADNKLAQAKARFDQENQENDTFFRENRNRAGARDEHRKLKKDIQDDLEEKVAKWEGYKKGLNEGLGELNKNKDIDIGEIESHAQDVSNFEEEKEEARNENRRAEQDQVRQVTDLKKRGFEPIVVEKSFKGTPQSVQLTFFNPKTKEFVNVAEFEVKGRVKVEGLEKLGFSPPQERTIAFGGKSFKFKSSVPIFKEKSGEIVTPFERTGITEQQIIAQHEKEAIAEFRKNKTIDEDFIILKPKDLPIGFGGQQTTSSLPITSVISREDYLRDIKKFDFGIGKVGKAFSFIDERVHFDFSVGGTPSSPKLKLISFGKKDKPTIVEKSFAQADVDFGKAVDKLTTKAIGQEKQEASQKEFQERADKLFQASFERKFGEDIILGGITFEKAEKQFIESEEAKLIQKQLKKENIARVEKLERDVPFLKGAGLGAVVTTINLGRFGLKAISTPTRSALTVGAVAGGGAVLRNLPTVASLGLTGGLATFGAIKFLDPASSFTERGGGLLTLTIAGTSLGFSAFRHFRTPVIKTVKIPKPKLTLKSKSVIADDIRIISNKGSINKIVFKSQKLSQTAQAGRRTIITTKGRVELESFWRALGVKPSLAKVSPIFRGVPTQQLGTKASFETLGGLIKVGKISGRQRAVNLLSKHGLSQSKINRILRFTAPRVTEQFLKEGQIVVKGGKAIGEITFLTKKPVISVDKTLGIKTRGGRVVQEVFNIQRKAVSVNGKFLVAEQKTRLAFFLEKGKLADLKSFGFTRGFTAGKTSGTQKGFEFIRKEKGLDIFREAKLKDAFSVSFEKNILPADNIIRGSKSQTKLIEKIVDLTKGNIKISTAVKKTTFTKTKDISKIINKLDDIKLDKIAGGKSTIKLLPKINQKQVQEVLKAGISPTPVKATALKNLINLKQFKNIASSNIAQLTAVQTAVALKQTPKLKTSLKLKNQLKVLLREDVVLKTNQIPALKTTTTTVSRLKSVLNLKLTSPTIPSLRTPTINIPKIPVVNIAPPTSPPPIFFLKAKISKKNKKQLEKQINIKAFLPDFTARSLGLTPETLTQKQAQKRLKKLLTGLEIRRAVVLR